MACRVGQLRKVFEDCVRTGAGVRGYHKEVRNMLGISRGSHGPVAGVNAAFGPREFGLKEVAEGMLGHDLYNRFVCDDGADRLIAESEGGILTASQYAAVNAWLGTTAGLLNAEVLTGYNAPDLIGRSLVEWKPGVMAEEVKIRRYTQPTERFDDLDEGQERPSGNLNAEWVRANKMKEQGMKLTLSWRSVHFTIEGDDLMDRAKDFGRSAAWVIEDRILKPLFGIENTYKFGSSPTDVETANNTYQTSTPWVNVNLANELIDENSLDVANQMLLNMRDTATGLPVDLRGVKNLVAMPAKERTARAIALFQEVRVVAGTMTSIGPPVYTRGLEPHISARARDLMVTFGWSGGALTSAQANQRWLYGDTKRAFQYRQARDFTQRTYTVAEERSLAARGLLMESIYDEMGSVTTVEPRAVTLNGKDA